MYLSGDSSYEYAIRAFDGQRRATLRRRTLRQRSRIFLDAAADVGERFVRTAVWHEARCTWVGPSAAERDEMSTRCAALGADVYSGTSGVSLFLAELHSAIGSRAVRHAAVGAMRHALSREKEQRTGSALAVFTGTLGVALAAAHVGRLLDEQELLEGAENLADRLRSSRRTREFDIISGNAGAIVAFLALGKTLEEPRFTSAAVTHGECLIASAKRSAGGLSWTSPGIRASEHLTGFAHGTAGAAFALIALFEATADERFREAAERAIAYERHVFDSAAGNWPDFRYDVWNRARGMRTVGFSAGWCHGAPGIALSRLRAFAAFADPTYKAEALLALQTTRRITPAWLQPEVFQSHSLCHGVLGNADILLHGAQVLGEAFADGAIEARRLARASLESGHWMQSTAPLGLMLGLAGAGYAWLRAHDAAVPSPLTVLRR